MISDLSPGDRLSLKGKLFELQKKLNIIDIERKMDEQFSFQPKILEYDLPNRKKDFVENANKADIMRKQKKQMLEQSLALQSEESCTFTPKIYKSHHAQNLDNRPAHIRLTEKAKVYKEAADRRKIQFSTFDDDGNRLFVPKVNPNKPAYLNKSLTSPTGASGDDTVVSQPNSTIGADEYLYQDARDREIRHQSLVIRYQQEIAKETNMSKVNSSSEKMLRRKMEKYSSDIFTVMDENHDDSIDYNDVVTVLEKYQLTTDIQEQVQNNQIFWSTIDQHQNGKVLRRNFIVICTAFLLNKTAPSIQSLIRKYEHRHHTANTSVSTSNERDNFSPIAPNILSMKEKDIHQFRQILSGLIHKLHEGERLVDTSLLHTSGHHNFGTSSVGSRQGEGGGGGGADDSEGLFKPKISSYSYKLAERKEKKDLELLASYRQQQHPNHHLSESQGDQSLSIEMSQLTLDDLEGSDGEEHQQHRTPKPNQQVIEITLPTTETSPLSKASHSTTSPIVNKSLSMTNISLTSGNSTMSKHDRLIAQALLLQKKREKLVEDVRKEQLANCTFHPQRQTKNYHPSKKDQNTGTASNPSDLEDMKRAALNNSHALETSNQEREEDEEREESQKEDPDSKEGTEEDKADVQNKDQMVPNEESNHPRSSQKGEDPTSSTEPPIYERLYALKDKKPKALTEIQPSYLQELQSCTFHPQLPKSSLRHLAHIKSKVKQSQQPRSSSPSQPEVLSSSQPVPAKPIEGFEKTVERMRKSHQEKERIKYEESDEYTRKVAEEKYSKSRELAKKGFQPFQFHSQERIERQRALEQAQGHRPDLIVDVNISANRSARIRVQHGDDPVELSQKFAKIYSLDKDATSILETVLRESMIQRGILPDPRKIQQQQQQQRSPSVVSNSRDRRGSFSGSENGSRHRHRRHQHRHGHHRSRRSSRSDSFLMNKMAEVFGGETGETNTGNEGGLASSSRPHRIDTENSELLGDTSIVVVEDDFSSYTQSASSHSSDDDYDSENSYDLDEMDATASYLQRHGSLRNRDRSSILSELL